MSTFDPGTILWDDPYLLAVVKPAGMLTQGLPGREPTLDDLVRRFLRPEDPSAVYLGTVHRLDRPVSGVVIFARSERAARRLAEQFRDRGTRKTYWAILERGPEMPMTPPEGLWDDWLGPVGEEGVASIVGRESRGAKRAMTRAERMEGAPEVHGRAAFVLRPETGRTHQLRVQSSARGWPIVGDRRYGAREGWEGPEGSIALHARAIEFIHPGTGREICLVAERPEAWGTATGGWPDRR